MTSVNPKLDLVLEKTSTLSPDVLWKTMTSPELIKQWGVPKPWTVVESEIDLRAGGINRMVMQSPDGKTFPAIGCYLEVVPGKKAVWTSAMLPGFRPAEPSEHNLLFTAVVTLEPHAGGTKYKAIAMHADEKSKMAHEQMGFVQGWGVCFDQMVEVAKNLAGK